MPKVGVCPSKGCAAANAPKSIKEQADLRSRRRGRTARGRPQIKCNLPQAGSPWAVRHRGACDLSTAAQPASVSRKPKDGRWTRADAAPTRAAWPAIFLRDARLLCARAADFLALRSAARAVSCTTAAAILGVPLPSKRPVRQVPAAPGACVETAPEKGAGAHTARSFCTLVSCEQHPCAAAHQAHVRRITPCCAGAGGRPPAASQRTRTSAGLVSVRCARIDALRGFRGCEPQLEGARIESLN